MHLLLALAAHAAPDAPLMLPLSLPEAGVARVRLSANAVGVDPGGLASTAVLLDANGAQVPFAVAPTDASPLVYTQLNQYPAGVGVWQVGPAEREVRQLRVRLAGLAGHGPVRVLVNGEVAGTLLAATIDGAERELDTVPIPAGRGPWRVELQPTHSPPIYDVAMEGVVVPPEHVPPYCVELPAENPALTEAGFARYTLDLGGPRRLRTIAVRTAERVFDRDVQVFVPTADANYYGSTQRIRRLDFGGAAIDESTFDASSIQGDAVIVDVRTDAGRTLPIDSFEVCSEAADLLVRDAGPGPHTLYLGGAFGSGSSDLSFATAELLRMAPEAVPSPDPAPNPEWVPPTDREGLADAGTLIPRVRWRWEQPVQGQGWLRVPLGREVLARSRSDLADLRLVDATDHQVPFVVRRSGREVAWETAEFTREEDGRFSNIRIPLGTDDAPVATVRLTTSRDQFSRSVLVMRDRGAITEPLRSVTWSGQTTGPDLAIRVDSVVGRELLVQIDNGDNAPLDITAVTVTYPEWELRAKVPEGARIWYGAPGTSQASYDLYLLEEELLRQPLAEGSLGAAAPIAGPSLGTLEKVGAFGAVAVLALTLLGMLVRLLLGRREDDEAAAPPAAGEPSAGPASAP